MYEIFHRAAINFQAEAERQTLKIGINRPINAHAFLGRLSVDRFHNFQYITLKFSTLKICHKQQPQQQAQEKEQRW